MRKLKLQVQITVDGYISGSNGEMDWMKFPWTDDIIQYVIEITNPVDTILLGKNLAQGFIPHWENVVKDPNNEEYPGAVKFTTTPKVVFTKTLDLNDPLVMGWGNTSLAKGPLEDEVNALKNQVGGDIIAYGGGSFVTSLIKAGLIDEYHLFINPTAIGNGMTIFKGLEQKQNLTLIKAMAFDCGIAVLQYRFDSSK